MSFSSVQLQVKDGIITVDFMFEGVFFKTKYEKVKALFSILKGQKYLLLSHKILCCLMFAIKPESFNTYSCNVSPLTGGNNLLYISGRLL